MTHFLQRTSLIALAAGALGACSSYAAEPLKPNFPVRAEEAPSATTSPPAALSAAAVPTVEEAPLTPVRPAAAVESRQLDAPPAAASRPIVLALAQTTSRSTRRAAPAEPASRTVTTRSVTGKVVDVAGSAETYKVRKGDTLDKIAKKLDTTVAQLRADNGLKKRESIHPGDELKGPESKVKAYVVVSGDTLFAIARRFTLTADDLAQENKIGRNSALRAGQRIRLPDGYKDKGPIVTTSRVAADDAQDEVEAAPTPSRSSSRSASRAQPRTETADEAEDAGPAFATSTKRTITGRVITVEGPAAGYTVRKGDNLEKIADKLDTTVDQLREDNGLKKRATIRPGQRLKGPRSEAKAYVANAGDTLAGIAKRFSTTEAKLRAENGLSRSASVRSGQRIRLPDGYRDRGAQTETTRTPVARPTPVTPSPVAPTPRPQPQAVEPPPARSEPPAPALPSSPQPYTGSATPPRSYTPAPVQAQPAPRGTPPVQTPTTRPYTPPPTSSSPTTSAPSNAPTSAAPVSDAQISELGRGRFIWPLQGEIVSDFGPKGGGQRNDGLNIGAAQGASIRAAAAGDVVYAGDQVPGFGNLVLIKHADGWVTAYAHLSRIDVKMQQHITQGQQVGQAGSTGGVPQPQLHFEVRYAPSPLERARPVDPKLVLPR